MYNKARPPGPKLPLASPDLQKTTMFYAWFLATQKNLDHPDLLSLLIAREVVLPSFCPGQWEFMVDPWTLNVSGELCGWNFSLWKWPNFLAARKNNSCIIPQKSIHWAMDLYQNNMVIPETQKKKRLIIFRRTVFSRKTPWSEVAPQYWEKGKHNICTPKIIKWR